MATSNQPYVCNKTTKHVFAIMGGFAYDEQMLRL